MAKTRKKKRYHFSLGNSSKGPIGFCGDVDAFSEKDALRKFRKAIPEEVSVRIDRETSRDVGYIQIYLNPDNMTIKDIDEVNELP